MEKSKGSQALLLVVLLRVILTIDNLALLPWSKNNPVIYFIFIILMWGTGSLLIGRYIKKNNARFQFYSSKKWDGTGVLIIFFVLMLQVYLSLALYVTAGERPLFIRELLSTMAPWYFKVGQWVYYLFELLIMLEIIICAQRAGELLTGKNLIPWGAVVLFLIWGLPHFNGHSWVDGLQTATKSFVFAAPFYVSKKDPKISYLSLCILWFV